MLRTPRPILYRTMANGGVNLKDDQSQAQALLSHRFLQVMTLHQNTLTYDASLLAIRHLEDKPSLNIRNTRGPMQVFADIYLEFAYAVISRVHIEEFSVKHFYDNIMQSIRQDASIPIACSESEWVNVCLNLSSLSDQPKLHLQMFLQVYN